jgi:hypothetical protein
MKSLLESILSSAKAGETEIIKKWINDFSGKYRNDNFYILRDNQEDPVIGIVNNKPAIFCKSSGIDINGDQLKNGKWPWTDLSILSERGDKYANVSMSHCVMHDLKSLPDCGTITFNDGNIIKDIIDTVPEHCDSVRAISRHGQETKIYGIEKLKLNELYIDAINVSLTNIKKCTANKFKFGENNINGFKPAGKYFDKEASEMIDEFIKNNNIKPENIEFVMLNNRTVASIVFCTLERDEKKNLWKIAKKRE